MKNLNIDENGCNKFRCNETCKKNSDYCYKYNESLDILEKCNDNDDVIEDFVFL